MGVKLMDPEKKKYRIAFWYKNRHHAKIVHGNKRLAQDVESKMKADLAEGTYFPDRQKPNPLFSEVADRFMKDFAEGKPSFKHFFHNTRSAKTFFGSRRLDEITPEDVRRYRAHLVTEGLHPVTVNHRQKNLRRIFNWAKELKLFTGENPASGGKVPLQNERPFWRREFLSKEQFQKLLDVAHPRIRPIILCAAFTGMRLGEIKRMNKRDVNLDNCSIMIPISKNGEPGSVPVTESLFRALEPIMKILPSPESPIFDWLNFERLWKYARRDGGIPKFHFHDLRHTFASHVAMGSKDSYALQNLLRLKTPGLVQRYAHLMQGHLRQAAACLEIQLPILPPSETTENRPETADHMAETPKVIIPIETSALPVSVA